LTAVDWQDRDPVRSDFHHPLTRHWRNSADDSVDDSCIGQKMLTKAFTRDVIPQLADFCAQFGAELVLDIWLRDGRRRQLGGSRIST
jgi:hypothetical protein